jgi:hypothetical protein
MKTILIIILISLPLFLVAQEFKSTDAKIALEKYNNQLKKIEELKIAADKLYKKDLADALIAATKAGNLDEANLIKATLDGKDVSKDPAKEVEKPVKVEKERLPGLVIYSAIYGSGTKTIDITSKIKGLVKDNSLEYSVNGLADCAPGEVKTLTIEYALNHIKLTAKSIEGGEIRINVKEKK